jgi:hypothetical protein
VLAAPVVEADVVLKPAFPLSQRPWSDAVPELLLGGALHPFYLAIEMGAAGSDAGVADAQVPEQASEIATELGAVIRLNAVDWEGQLPQQMRQDSAYGGSGTLL